MIQEGNKGDEAQRRLDEKDRRGAMHFVVGREVMLDLGGEGDSGESDG